MKKIIIMGLAAVLLISCTLGFEENISVANLPTRTTYRSGNVFDPDGLVLKITANGGVESFIRYEDNNMTFKQDGKYLYPLRSPVVSASPVEVIYRTRQTWFDIDYTD